MFNDIFYLECMRLQNLKHRVDNIHRHISFNTKYNLDNSIPKPQFINLEYFYCKKNVSYKVKKSMLHRSKQLFFINCSLFVVLCVEMFFSTTKQTKL